jgi:hypothetical protein
MPVGPLSFSALERTYAETDVLAAQARAMKLAMTPRQVELNYYYSFYAAEQYDSRVVAWDGTKVPRLAERDGIVRQTNIPPGFIDAGHAYDAVPLAYRKPEVEHHLVRKVVFKFTALLFGERTRPKLIVKDDDKATEWLTDMTKSCGYWQRWVASRDLAGAMGSTAMTFKFVAGRLEIEVHDTRWCKPVITNHRTGDCSSLEIKYMYEDEWTDPKGHRAMRWFWYRRVIDQGADTTFQPVMVDPDKELTWTVDPEKTVQHNLGFFPGVWVKNSEAPNAIDGDSDCKGVYGNTEMMDRLLTQAAVGAVNNADPTLWLATQDQRFDDVRKGSRNAIRTTEGGKVGYVEMAGSGTASALTVFDKVDNVTSEAVGYVRDEEREGGAMTAEEVRRRQGAEFAGTEKRREHYAHAAIIPLTERIVRAAMVLSRQEVRDPATGVVTSVTTIHKPLPKALASGELASKHIDDAGVTIEVEWPPLAPQTAQDAQAAATAVAAVVLAGIMDKETAARYIADPFGVADVDDMIRRAREEVAAKAMALESELLAGAAPVVSTPAPAPAPAPVSEAPPAEPEQTIADPALAAAGGAAPPPTEKAADAALNGAQVVALAGLSKDVFAGLMPRDAAIAIAMIAFPSADPRLIEVSIPLPRPPPLVPVDPLVDPTIPPADPTGGAAPAVPVADPATPAQVPA